jgi:hypothetical protein
MHKSDLCDLHHKPAGGISAKKGIAEYVHGAAHLNSLMRRVTGENRIRY